VRTTPYVIGTGLIRLYGRRLTRRRSGAKGEGNGVSERGSQTGVLKPGITRK